MVYAKKTSNQGPNSSLNLYQLIEDKVNIKKVDLNMLHQIKNNNEAITDVFTLTGSLFVCIGNVIQGYQLIMNEEKQFEAKNIYNLTTEKVRISLFYLTN